MAIGVLLAAVATSGIAYDFVFPANRVTIHNVSRTTVTDIVVAFGGPSETVTSLAPGETITLIRRFVVEGAVELTLRQDGKARRIALAYVTPHLPVSCAVSVSETGVQVPSCSYGDS